MSITANDKAMVDAVLASSLFSDAVERLVRKAWQAGFAVAGAKWRAEEGMLYTDWRAYGPGLTLPGGQEFHDEHLQGIADRAAEAEAAHAPCTAATVSPRGNGPVIANVVWVCERCDTVKGVGTTAYVTYDPITFDPVILEQICKTCDDDRLRLEKMGELRAHLDATLMPGTRSAIDPRLECRWCATAFDVGESYVFRDPSVSAVDLYGRWHEHCWRPARENFLAVMLNGQRAEAEDGEEEQ